MPSFRQHACIDCGEIRLVQTYHGEPRSLRCRSCSKSGVNHPQYGKFGEEAAHWKGGEWLMNGYVWLRAPGHPRAVKGGYVKRARIILEEKLGRYLLPGMEPHHRNEIKVDDRPENLEEMTHSGHAANHFKDRNKAVSGQLIK